MSTNQSLGGIMSVGEPVTTSPQDSVWIKHPWHLGRQFIARRDSLFRCVWDGIRPVSEQHPKIWAVADGYTKEEPAKIYKLIAISIDG